MRTKVILILALALATPVHTNWLTDTMSSSYQYLRKSLFGEDDFVLPNGNQLDKELSGRFVEMKDDGVSLTYNLLYYNFALNLERECYMQDMKTEECESFIKHIKYVIISHIKPDGQAGYEYMLIDEFYNRIFNADNIDKSLNINEVNQLKEVLAQIFETLESTAFEQSKTKLTNHYNQLLKKLMDYLWDGAGVKPKAIGKSNNPLNSQGFAH